MSTAAILGAFPNDIPSRALLAAAIEGKSKGRVILDESRGNPLEAGSVIVLNRNGTTYIGRGVSQEFFRTALSVLRRGRRLVLAMTARQEAEYDWNWVDDRPVFERFEYTELDWDVVANLSGRLPGHRSIVRIDRELFRRCVWHDEMCSMLGGEDQFLDNAIGICQMEGNDIITEAYGILSDTAGAEIGGITYEAYRRSGNGAVTCARLLTDFLRDCRPIYWCCDQDNVASASTAQRLGFENRSEYRFVIVPEAEES